MANVAVAGRLAWAAFGCLFLGLEYEEQLIRTLNTNISSLKQKGSHINYFCHLTALEVAIMIILYAVSDYKVVSVTTLSLQC